MIKIVKPKIVVIALVCILVLTLIAILVIVKYGKLRNVPVQIPAAGVLTQQEIEEALSKKAENPGAALGEKEIEQGLGKKVPVSQRLIPLTEEEIQKSLQVE